MGREVRIPAWILKYKEKIERGEITIEQILEEENSRREKPIKIATVKRAINSLGYSIEELRRRGMARSSAAAAGDEDEDEDVGEHASAAVAEGDAVVELNAGIWSAGERAGKADGGEGEAREVAEREVAEREVAEREEKKRRRKEGAPAWILKYKEKIERGEITIEQILEEENSRREKPIKIATVKRAINALGFPVRALKAEEERRTLEVGEHEAAETRHEEAAEYRIGNLSEDTRMRFREVKRRWEESLGKSMSNDHFMNILLALASLVERGKTLAMKK